MTVKQIKDLWFSIYVENLQTEYSAFYKIIKRIEKQRRDNNEDS